MNIKLNSVQHHLCMYLKRKKMNAQVKLSDFVPGRLGIIVVRVCLLNYISVSPLQYTK